MLPYTRFIRSTSVCTIAVSALGLLGAGVASAHVTIDPDGIATGEYNQLTFRVPNESPTASTVKLELTFPTDPPITSVRTALLPGWKSEVIKERLNPPLREGTATITEAVRTVIWTAEPGNGIGHGQYGQFPVLTGSVPTTADVLVIAATETYSDGQVVRWNQPPSADGIEPEHPAPVVKISEVVVHDHGAAARPARQDPPRHAAQTLSGNPDNTARWMAGAGLLIAALGLGAGGGAIVANRRLRRNGHSTPEPHQE